MTGSSGQHPPRRALITGASSGIGAAIARQLMGVGTELVLVGRDRSRTVALAEELGGPAACEYLVADLAHADGIAVVADRLRRTDGPVDLLVNCAGYGLRGDFATADIETHVDLLMVNAGALMRLCHAAARAMTARPGGAILNIASTGGFGPVPQYAVYAAAKAFVISFSEAIRVELAGQGVRVICVCPGFTRTRFVDRAGGDPDRIPADRWQSAEQVAAIALRAVSESAHVVLTNPRNLNFATDQLRRSSDALTIVEAVAPLT